MKTCLRVLLQRGTRLLRKENNIFQNGRKEERRKSVRKTSCGTNDRIDIATNSYKMLPELGQMVLERVIVYGKEIMVIRFLDGTEIKVKDIGSEVIPTEPYFLRFLP